MAEAASITAKQGPFELIGVEFPAEKELEEIGKARLHIKTLCFGWLWDQDVLIVTRQASHGDITRHLGTLDLDGNFTKLYSTTESLMSVTHLKAFPEFILFCTDNNGDEDCQVMALNINTKEATPITGKCRCNHILCTESELYWISSLRTDGKSWDVYSAPIADFFLDSTPTKVDGTILFESDPGVFVQFSGYSPDGSKVMWKEIVGPKTNRLWLRQGDNEPTCVVGKESDVNLGSCLVQNDGFYYSSNELSDFLCLMKRDFNSGAIERITYDGHEPSDTATLINWDVQIIGDPSRERCTVRVIASGSDELYSFNQDGLQKMGLPGEGICTRLKWSKFSKRKLAMNFSNHNTNNDIYIYDDDEKSWAKLTDNDCNINLKKKTEVDLIHYKSFDGRSIPAIHYNTGTRGPCMICIHGGPASKWVPTFLRSSGNDIHFFLEQGIHVIAPNVRGSSGYGSEYQALDDKELREDSIKDIGALLKWCGDHADIDDSRIGVKGGSYGGFMVLASLCAFPKLIRCAISNVGIANWVTFLENTPEFRRDHRRNEYGDERDPKMREFLLRISPLTNCNQIECPVFFGHGNKDSRVPASETRMILEAMQKKGNPCWALFSDQDGHGFRKPDSKNLWITLSRKFVLKYLLEKDIQSNL